MLFKKKEIKEGTIIKCGAYLNLNEVKAAAYQAISECGLDSGEINAISAFIDTLTEKFFTEKVKEVTAEEKI